MEIHSTGCGPETITASPLSSVAIRNTGIAQRVAAGAGHPRPQCHGDVLPSRPAVAVGRRLVEDLEVAADALGAEVESARRLECRYKHQEGNGGGHRKRQPGQRAGEEQRPGHDAGPQHRDPRGAALGNGVSERAELVGLGWAATGQV